MPRSLLNLITNKYFMGKKKILFIEDESALQKTLSDMMPKEKYKIISALDGETGLRLARSQEPDLILLDLRLPQKNGFEVLKLLKQEKSTSHIPVIILTNLEGAEDIQKALSLGATTYLVKANYDLQEVIEKIEKTLDKKALDK